MADQIIRHDDVAPARAADEARWCGWRYQAVYIDDEAGHAVTVCEVYFDADNKLKAWTENSAVAPHGETLEDLSHDLCWMLASVWKWKPVAFSDLHVGMTFERTGIDVERLIAAMNAARRIQ
jgi:hypothetical protein